MLGLATLYVMRAEFDKTARLGEQILGFAEQDLELEQQEQLAALLRSMLRRVGIDD